MVKVTNLSTLKEVGYLHDNPKQAVVCAYEQFTIGNWNTWTYKPFAEHPEATEGKMTVACGDWVAMKKEV